jgi:hypothetical protein
LSSIPTIRVWPYWISAGSKRESDPVVDPEANTLPTTKNALRDTALTTKAPTPNILTMRAIFALRREKSTGFDKVG